MIRLTHQLALLGLGFAAGSGVVALLGQLPGLAEPVPRQAAMIAAPAPQSYADAVAAAAPAVVNVYGRVGPTSERAGPAPAHRPRRFGGTSLGSGVVVSDDGLIATNAHIVEQAAAIQAELPDGRLLAAALVGVDRETDLAVLRVQTGDSGELTPIRLGDPDSLAIGDVVLAIGNPYGLGQTVSLGIVSATGRSHLGLTELEDFIQTDAAINPGSSGGALVDSVGRLVGINTAILSESGRSEGVGFAIPVDQVFNVVDQLAHLGEVRRGWIGIGGRSLTPPLASRYGLRAPHGVLVTSVADDGPAAAAGLRPGDVITRVGGADLHSSLALRERVTSMTPGSSLELELWRGSEQLHTEVAAGLRTSQAINTGRDQAAASARRQPIGAGCRGLAAGDC